MAEAAHIFSVRNRTSTNEQGLNLSLTEELREEIWAVLDQFNFAFDVNRSGTVEDGTEIEVTDVLTQVGEDLEQLYELEAPGSLKHNGEALFLHLEGLLLAADPRQVLDILELFYRYLNDAHKLEFERSINILVEEKSVNWRMTDGEFSPLIPGPTLTNVTKPTEQVPENDVYETAFARFQLAQRDLESENYGEALEGTCECLEHIIQFLLEQSSRNPASADRMNPGTPNADLSCHLGLAFGDQLLNALSFLRNVLARKNQGISSITVNKAYAQLGINLASALLFFAADLILAEPLTGHDFSTAEDFKQGVA
jgi:hypothetical protein